MYSPKQIILDLEEYVQLRSELDNLKRKPEDGSLTREEIEEATGLIVTRAVQNPGLFRVNLESLDLGKYKAIFVVVPEKGVSIRFVRT